MEENNKLSERQKILRAAQIMFEQGNMAAAEAIFKNILSEVGDESLEGALCLSNLTDIHEAKGDLKAALDCGLRLLRQQRHQQPPAVEAARAEQAAEWMTKLGQQSEAAQMKQHAERIYQREGPSQAMAQPQPLDSNDPDWLLHALKNGAYKAFERSRRQHFEQNSRISEAEPPRQQQAFAAPKAPDGGDRGLKSTFENKSEPAIRDDLDTYGDGGDRLGQFERASSPAPPRVNSPRTNRSTKTGENNFTWLPQEEGEGGDQAQYAQPPQAVHQTEPEDDPWTRKTTVQNPEPQSNRKFEPLPEPNQAAQPVRPTGFQPTRSSEFQPTRSAEFQSLRHMEQSETTPGRPHSKGSNLRSFDSSPAESPGEAIANFMARFMPRASDDAEISAPQNPSEMAPPNPAVNFIAAVAIVGIIMFALWNLTPHGKNPDALYASIPHRYKDASQTTVLMLSNVHTLEMTSGADTVQAGLEYYSGDWRDFFSLAFGASAPPYELQLGPAGLTDLNGATYYVADGPELQMAERSKYLIEDGSTFFERHKAYPAKIDDFNVVDTTYENPFTKKQQKIEFQALTFGKGTSDQESDNARADFYRKISKPEYWNVPKKMEPGGIRCITAVFKSTRGDIQSFVVSAAGANGNVLQTREPGTAFRQLCEDGKPREQTLPPLRHNFAAWVSLQPISGALNFWITNIAWMMTGFVAFITAAFALSSPRKGHARPLWFFTCGMFAILAAYYLGLTYFRSH